LETVAEVLLPDTIQVSPSGDEVMTLSKRGQLLPVDAAFQMRLACALPAVALRLLGAPGGRLQAMKFGEDARSGAAGGVAGVTALDGDEASPVPAMLVAVTVNV